MKVAGLVALIILSVLLINQFIFKVANNSEKVYFLTSDGKKISANFFRAENPKGWLILSHMMPATKESWQEFAKEMQEFGYESLAIDLRGHGESESGPDGYQNFSDAEHQASIRDLEAGWEFLKSAGAAPEKTILAGASIGANLSLEFFARNTDFKKAVLLSPGFDYHGIKTEPLVVKLQKGRSLLFATSKDDGDNATEVLGLYKKSPKELNKHIIIYDHGGHGTEMLKVRDELNLSEAIKKFLDYGTIN